MTKLTNGIAILAPVWLGCFCGPLFGAPYFAGLGDLPGGEYRSFAQAVSADGAVVVGGSVSGFGFEAFRWTQASGMVGLGDLPGGEYRSGAAAVSADGTVVVGSGKSEFGTEAYLWTQASGMVGLGDLPGGEFLSVASDVSADGSVVVGYSVDSFVNNWQAFRWTDMTGMIALGELQDMSFSQASGVSADGSVIVGGSSDFTSVGTVSEAFRWTQAGGMESLGRFLPDVDSYSEAEAVSADGSVIVGFNALGYPPDTTLPPAEFYSDPFRWTQETGMVSLAGGCVSFTLCKPNDVSANGSVIVGESDLGLGVREAFIWEAANGLRRLHDVLVNENALGSSLKDWQLNSATGISSDGLTIVGFGINPLGSTEAWIARLVGEPTLPGDYNGNSVVDTADYVVWRDSLGQMGIALAADGNNNNEVDVGDYDVWRAQFGQSAGSSSSLNSTAASATVPEPSAGLLILIVSCWTGTRCCYHVRQSRKSS